ncbi:MAG: DUF4214 domain-containing protein [Rhodoferax sp.]|nr:DUF4214 domain-containing protein [Rhodoferax sp.]
MIVIPTSLLTKLTGVGVAGHSGTGGLHREPDAGGRDYYVGQITSHSKTVGQVLAEISDSPENIASLTGVMENGVVYTPWV